MANNLAAFNSEAWSERLVTKLDQINVMLPLVNRNWEGDLRQNKTVHVRTAGNISMGSYSRGATISYQDLTPTNESFTVNDGEYFAFEVDDLDKAQSDVNAMDVYLKRAVVAMNNTVESKLLAVYPSAGVQLGAPVAGSGAILTPVITERRGELGHDHRGRYGLWIDGPDHPVRGRQRQRSHGDVHRERWSDRHGHRDGRRQ